MHLESVKVVPCDVVDWTALSIAVVFRVMGLVPVPLRRALLLIETRRCASEPGCMGSAELQSHAQGQGA